MPQHKVARAVKEIAGLRAKANEDAVLQDASGLIDALLVGDKQGAVSAVAGELLEFQNRHGNEILEGAKAGERLGRGLMEHVG